MRVSLGLLLVGSLALVACGEDDGGGIRRGPAPEPAVPGASGTSPTSGPAGPAAAACPAGIPEPKSISAVDKNATDMRIILGNVVYRDGTKILKVDPYGKRSELYTSPDLVHSYSDDEVIVTIESPTPPDAVVKVMPAGPTTDQDPTKVLVQTATPPGWLAGGTTVFASDATSFYVLADVANTGDAIYKVSKENPNVMTLLAQLDAPLGDAQLVGNDVWFVRDAKRVYKVEGVVDKTENPEGLPPGVIPGATQASPATEIFGLGYADCKLAVGGNHAFCSTGKALEQRDLTGANVTTVFDPMKSSAPSLLGAAMYGGDTVFVRSLPSSTNDALKNGIRAIKSNGPSASEKLIACGREPINAFAAGSTIVAWAEQGKGVFTAPR